MNLQPVPERKAGYGHGAPYHFEMVQILGAQGTVSKNEDGGYTTHLHGAVLDMEDGVHGGHFVKAGCPVIVTAEVTLAEVEGVRLVRRLDPEIGRALSTPEEVRH